jgi:hypothetical protein
MLGAHGRRAGRGRETDGVSAATWPDQGGSVTWLPKVCSALLPALLPLVIAFRCLEPNGHTGPQVTAMGCLGAPDHRPGQYIPATGTGHQHSPAQALLAGFRFGMNRLVICMLSRGSTRAGIISVRAGLMPPTLLRCPAAILHPRRQSAACGNIAW